MPLTGSLDVEPTADRVSFSFVVENTGDEALTLSFRDAQHAEFVVLDGESTVWRWSADRMFAQVLTTADLAPGESTTYEAEWDAPSAGDFTALASLEAEGYDCEARTELSI